VGERRDGRCFAYLRGLQRAKVGLTDSHEGRKAFKDISLEPRCVCCWKKCLEEVKAHDGGKSRNFKISVALVGKLRALHKRVWARDVSFC
jgi:hypothetical protein